MNAGGLSYVGYSQALGKNCARAIGIGVAVIIATVTRPATILAVGPVATPPYTLTALTTLVPPAAATQPDDLAVSADGADLWVGYGNGVDTFGKGAPSNLVEYNLSTGAMLQNLTIPGHLDGLKINSRPMISGRPRMRTAIRRWQSSITRTASSRFIRFRRP